MDGHWLGEKRCFVCKGTAFCLQLGGDCLSSCLFSARAPFTLASLRPLPLPLTTTRHLNPREEIVVPLTSNTVEDMESNVNRIVQWVNDYKQQHGL